MTNPARLIVLLALSAATAASAQSRHDSTAPIDFGADHIELQDKANRAILSVVSRSSRPR